MKHAAHTAVYLIRMQIEKVQLEANALPSPGGQRITGLSNFYENVRGIIDATKTPQVLGKSRETSRSVGEPEPGG